MSAKAEAPFWANWFEGKSFTSDLSSVHFARWDSVLRHRRNDPMRILEIGSWEGRSAVFFAQYFPNGSVTCIDTFAGGPVEHYGAMVDEIAQVESRFDANTKDYGVRVTKVKSTSISGLGKLQSEERTFDLIYIDGDHRRDIVLAESLLVWPLLTDDGILIWDDYKAGRQLPMAERVRQGVDIFLLLHAGEFEELARGSQMIVRKHGRPERDWRQEASLLSRVARNMFR